MPQATCSIEECGRPVHGWGWCSIHYHRWRKKGDPLAPVRRQRRDAAVIARLADRLLIGDDCWEWTGRCSSNGYGLVTLIGRKTLRVHIVVYELLVGPVPDGLQLDHTCHNADPNCIGGPTCAHRRCANPKHLEPVTHAENVRRGRAGAFQRSKTHCPAGHEYTPENTRSIGHGRECWTCIRERDRLRARAKRH